MISQYESQEKIRQALDALDAAKVKELCTRYRKLNPAEAPPDELKSGREGQYIVLRDIYGRTLRHYQI
jgi:hypothetical protein